MVGENVAVGVNDYARANALHALRRVLLRHSIAEELAEHRIIAERRCLRRAHALGRSDGDDGWCDSGYKICIRRLHAGYPGMSDGRRICRFNTSDPGLSAARAKRNYN